MTRTRLRVVVGIVLAAAALYAFEHHQERLAEDHERARRLAEGLRNAGYEAETPETNIVLATVPDPASTVAELAELGIAAVTVAGKVRFVTHRDVDAADISEALERLRRT